MSHAHLLQLASNHMQAGHFGDAERLYREVLAAEPEEPNALYGLGLVALMAKAHKEAVQLIGAAARKAPRNGAWQLTLGDALRYAGRLPEAVRAYERAVRLAPNLAVAHNNLGAAYQDLGDIKHAMQAFRRATDLSPRTAQYLANLGGSLQKLGRSDEARTYLEKALILNPNCGSALVNLGNIFIARGEFEDAIEPLERAVAVMPDVPEPRDNLSVALSMCGRHEEAIGVLMENLKHQATPLTYKGLCESFVTLRRPSEGEIYAREGLSRFPDHASLHAALGEALIAQGRVDDGLAVYRDAQSIVGSDKFLAGAIAFMLNAKVTPPAEQRAAAETAGRELAATPMRLRPLQPRDVSRRLRVGYLSPDFRRHPVAYFFEGLLTAHDRDQIEAVCYNANLAQDDMTKRLQNRANQWVDIGLMTDDEAALRIQGDQIDILVDLAGHTTGNRLGILARRPAPIQMTYLGYPNTTGLPMIDFRLTDAVADPESLTDPWYTEKLIRLPRVFLAYSAPEDAPQVEVPPVTRGSPLTFGCFNAIHKLSDTVLDLWAAVLGAVPGSRLLLKTGEFSDAGVRARYSSLFATRGIDSDRLLLLGFESERKNHLATYDQVDIALDSFPYNGATTTCEALYMGVPVVTLAGQTHVSRVGASLLGSVGLMELVAEDEHGFVATAARLASDQERLASLRAGLRERMSSSPLMDAPSLARAVETVYREVWTAACATPRKA